MSRLFIGLKGHVVCIDRDNGNELWRTKIRSGDLTNVYVEDGQVIAYSNGHLFALSSENGRVIWENELKGLGYGACIIAGQQASGVVAAQGAQQQAAATAAVGAVVATSSSN